MAAAKTPIRTGVTDRIRNTIRDMGFFTARQVTQKLRDYNKESIYRTLSELLAAGEIDRLARGFYRTRSLRKRHTGVQHRVFRAMYVRGTFSAREIRRLTDTQLNYTQVLIRRMRIAGYVEETGKARAHDGRLEMRFRIRDRDKFYLEVVRGGQ